MRDLPPPQPRWPQVGQRGALNPRQALGAGSDVHPSVHRPRALPPGVAAQPRTGLPAYLPGLGAGASAAGAHLTASPACQVPHCCSWPYSRGSPPCPAGHLVRRGWGRGLSRCHPCAALSHPCLGERVGSASVSRCSWTPDFFRVPGSWAKADGCRGGVFKCV